MQCEWIWSEISWQCPSSRVAVPDPELRINQIRFLQDWIRAFFCIKNLGSLPGFVCRPRSKIRLKSRFSLIFVVVSLEGRIRLFLTVGSRYGSTFTGSATLPSSFLKWFQSYSLKVWWYIWGSKYPKFNPDKALWDTTTHVPYIASILRHKFTCHCIT